MQMYKKCITVISFIVLMVLPVIAFAHPGHGATDGHSLWHYLTEPFHIISMIAALILLVGVIYWYVAKKRKKATVHA